VGAILVASCLCQNAYQDGLYGRGKRLFNLKFDKAKGSLCTVCGKSGPGVAVREVATRIKQAKKEEPKDKSGKKGKKAK